MHGSTWNDATRAEVSWILEIVVATWTGARSVRRMSALRVGHVEVFVRDTAAARRFYEEILGFTVTAVQHEGRIVWLEMGGTTLVLRPGESPRGDRNAVGEYTRGGPALVLYTDDHAATLAALAARGAMPCADDGPGCPLFRDPDGNWIQIVDPREH